VYWIKEYIFALNCILYVNSIFFSLLFFSGGLVKSQREGRVEIYQLLRDSKDCRLDFHRSLVSGLRAPFPNSGW